MKDGNTPLQYSNIKEEEYRKTYESINSEGAAKRSAQIKYENIRTISQMLKQRLDTQEARKYYKYKNKYIQLKNSFK